MKAVKATRDKDPGTAHRKETAGHRAQHDEHRAERKEVQAGRRGRSRGGAGGAGASAGLLAGRAVCGHAGVLGGARWTRVLRGHRSPCQKQGGVGTQTLGHLTGRGLGDKDTRAPRAFL